MVTDLTLIHVYLHLNFSEKMDRRGSILRYACTARPMGRPQKV